MSAPEKRTWSFWFGVQDITEAEADEIAERLSDALCLSEGPDHECDHVWVGMHKPIKDEDEDEDDESRFLFRYVTGPVAFNVPTWTSTSDFPLRPAS